MQPENNRPPDEAEDEAGKDADGVEFSPGDSFSNDPSDQAGTGELPSWLQNFADVAVESSGGGQQESATGASERAAPQSTATPAQSSMSQTAPAEAMPQSTETSTLSDVFSQPPGSGDSSFFSEDDLPEWLRALSTDSEPPVAGVPVTTMQAASATPNGALLVPAVSRAWVTASDQPEVSPTANLMSSLVNVIDSRPDAVAVEPAVTTPTRSPNVGSASSPHAATTVAAGSATTNGAAPGNRSRMLLIAAIVILVLIIVVMLLGN